MSCVERFLGFIYRVYLSRNIGAEALGIYQVALSVFGVLLTVSASGIPITVSRMITKYKTQKFPLGENQTVSSGIFTCLAFTLPVCLIIFLKPNILSFAFSDKRCLYLFKIIIFGLTITSVYAVIRGFFWGNKLFFTYSAIELIEETAMLVAGIILIPHAQSSIDGAMLAGVAIVISYIVSFILSTFIFFIKGGKLASPLPQLKPLLSSSMPITAMRTSTSLINSLIAIILPARLIAFGLDKTSAMTEFGVVSGMTLPLLFIPSTVIGSIALVLVPELSANYYENNHLSLKNNIEKAVKTSTIIACLIIPIFVVCGQEIGDIIYKNIKAGTYLSYSAIIMLPMSISMITTSLLNSINKEKSTLIYFLSGTLFTVASILFLSKYIGAYSLFLGLGLSYVICSTLNLVKLHKSTTAKPKTIKFIILSIVSLFPTVIFGVSVNGILSKTLPQILAVIICSTLTFSFELIIFLLFGALDDIIPYKKRIKKAVPN